MKRNFIRIVKKQLKRKKGMSRNAHKHKALCWWYGCLDGNFMYWIIVTHNKKILAVCVEMGKAYTELQWYRSSKMLVYVSVCYFTTCDIYTSKRKKWFWTTATQIWWHILKRTRKYSSSFSSSSCRSFFSEQEPSFILLFDIVPTLVCSFIEFWHDKLAILVYTKLSFKHHMASHTNLEYFSIEFEGGIKVKEKS